MAVTLVVIREEAYPCLSLMPFPEIWKYGAAKTICTRQSGGDRACLASRAAFSLLVLIDAHHHLWDLAAREHRWLMDGQAWATDDELARLRRSFTLADLVPVAAAAGVTGTVVIQTAAEPWETPDLLALAVGRDPYTTKGPGRRAPHSPAIGCG